MPSPGDGEGVFFRGEAKYDPGPARAAGRDTGAPMAKQVTAQVKLQCPGGSATPAPPVGPALGAHGVNIGQFVKQFNDRTQDRKGMMLPVVISVFSDRTFDFVIKSPPAAVLLKQAAGLPIEKKKAGELIQGEEKTKKTGKYK